MLVRATKRGFDGTLREPGDEFTIPDHLFSAKWMVQVGHENTESQRLIEANQHRQHTGQPELEANQTRQQPVDPRRPGPYQPVNPPAKTMPAYAKPGDKRPSDTKVLDDK